MGRIADGRMESIAFDDIKSRNLSDGFPESGNATIHRLIIHAEAIEQELEEADENFREWDRKQKSQIASLKEMNSLQLATINERTNELFAANARIEELAANNAKLDRENQMLVDTPAGEIQRLADETERILLAEVERLLALIADMNRQREGLIVAPSRIALPAEVAEALDECFNIEEEDADDIICELLDMSHQGRTYPYRFEVLRSFALSRGYDLAAALVRGYEVEVTKEEKLRKGIDSVYEEWGSEPDRDDFLPGHVDGLVKRIADFVTKFIDKN